jgi:hypothetical protein
VVAVFIGTAIVWVPRRPTLQRWRDGEPVSKLRVVLLCAGLPLVMFLLAAVIVEALDWS